MADFIVAGLVAGVVMQVGAMALYYSGFTSLNIPRYIACLVTTSWSAVAFAIATTLHLIISVGFAYLYQYAYQYFGYAPSWQSGLVFGLIHDIGVGFILPGIDLLNRCVQAKKIKALGFFSTNYGVTATLTFLIGHLIFGAIVGMML